MISEDDVRRIIREEIQAALKEIAGAAEDLYLDETNDVKTEALLVVQAAAERAADSLIG
jgi:hypothetical protein